MVCSTHVVGINPGLGQAVQTVGMECFILSYQLGRTFSTTDRLVVARSTCLVVETMDTAVTYSALSRRVLLQGGGPDVDQFFPGCC